MFIDRLHYEPDKIRFSIRQRAEIEKIMRQNNCSMALAVRSLIDKALESLGQVRVQKDH